MRSDRWRPFIELVEMLFDEWYKEREARSVRLANIAAMSAEKKTARLKGKVVKLIDDKPAEDPPSPDAVEV